MRTKDAMTPRDPRRETAAPLVGRTSELDDTRRFVSGSASCAVSARLYRAFLRDVTSRAGLRHASAATGSSERSDR